LHVMHGGTVNPAARRRCRLDITSLFDTVSMVYH
jgi:hypothetical protein